MKSFSIHQVRNIVVVAVVGVVFGVTYFLNPSFFGVNKVRSATTDNVSGWAWSENIGWVSFNSTDCDTDLNTFVDVGPCGGDNTTTPLKSYGVSVDASTGNFSGDAWSENIGWVSFNRSETGNPPSAPFNGGSGTIANYDKTTSNVTGWARALVGCEVTPGVAVTACASSSAGPAAGGWDGWIKLSDNSVPSWVGKGVTISNNLFSGYGWSDSDPIGSKTVGIGWIDFAPKVGGIFVGVKLNAPVCTVATAIFSGACQALAQCSTAGIEVGICLTGGVITRPCTAVNVCPVPTAPGSCGDGICTPPGETLLTCPKDCKGKVQQF